MTPLAPTRHTWVPIALPIAWMQLRQTWHLMVITLLGLIFVVALIGGMTLFAHSASTTGLRTMIDANALNQVVTLTTTTHQLTSTDYQDIAQTLRPMVQHGIGTYLQSTPVSTVKIEALQVVDQTTNTPNFDNFTLYGSPVTTFASRVVVKQGRLPTDDSRNLEVAIFQDDADKLNVTIGTIIMVRADDARDAARFVIIPLHVVGILASPNLDDLYWNLNTPTTSSSDEGSGTDNTFHGLVDQTTLLHYFDTVAQESLGGFVQFAEPSTLEWQYHLNLTNFNADNLLTTINDFATVSIRLNDFGGGLYAATTLTGNVFDPNSILVDYNNQIIAARVPLLTLEIGFVLVALYFVALMGALVVERQAPIIALLRERGFSRWHIFNAFFLICTLLGSSTFIGGLVLALPLAQVLALWQFHTVNLAYLDGNLLPLFGEIGWYALGVVACLWAALIGALSRIGQLDILMLRRQSARTTDASIWQRLRLDVVMAVIALLGYGASLYITQTISGFNPEIDRLFVPLTLIGPLFLALAFLLSFLRFFAWLIRGGEHLAQHSAGTAPLLGLAQLARAPQQVVRMILLLTLAVTCTLVLFTFAASQNQRAADIAAEQAGADFSGTSNDRGLFNRQFFQLPGVTNIAFGYTTDEDPTNVAVAGRYTLIAANATTFAGPAVWPSEQSVASLMAQLSQARTTLSEQAVPAIVDATTWTAFHLTRGASFSLGSPSVRFLVIGKVATIPLTTLGDGGVLVDLDTYNTLVVQVHNGVAPVAPNTVWLRTTSAAAVTVHAALTHAPLQLDTLHDRRAIIQALTHEPLALTLIGILGVGVAIPLLLALVGSLLTSLLRVRQQRQGFVILRALGATSRQIMAMLLWEQGLIYGTALFLGSCLGWFLSLSLVPSLLFSSTTSVGTSSNPTSSFDFFALQNSPPVRVILPTIAPLVLVMCIVIGALVLGGMTLAATRAPLTQGLRLSED